MKAYWEKRREEMQDKQDALLQEMRDEQTGISSHMKGVEKYTKADMQQMRDEGIGSISRVNLVVSDLVNHPPHYTFGKYEVIDVLMDWFGSEPLLWNATKYLARWDKKGDAIQNLEKAVWYINKKIEQLKGE